MIFLGDIQKPGKRWKNWLTPERPVLSVRLDGVNEAPLPSADASIGLSNFNILKTKRILDIARIVPAVNQVEIHPYGWLPLIPQT
jgi:hypothetical protein